MNYCIIYSFTDRICVLWNITSLPYFNIVNLISEFMKKSHSFGNLLNK